LKATHDLLKSLVTKANSIIKLEIGKKVNSDLTLPIIASFLVGTLTTFIILMVVRAITLYTFRKRAEKVQFVARHSKVIEPQKRYELSVLTQRSEPLGNLEQTRLNEADNAIGAAEKESIDSTLDYIESREESLLPLPYLSELTFAPMVDGIEFTPRIQTFSWKQEIIETKFYFRTASTVGDKTVDGFLRVYAGLFLLAAVPLKFKVQNESISEPVLKPLTCSSSAVPFGKIFVSYSHKDKFIINEYLQFSRALGGEYFIDVMGLRAGENWSDALKAKIDEADAFQLFWSQKSMRSRFVGEEWRHALSLKRDRFIYPAYWETPLPEDKENALPPPEICKSHFHRFDAPPKVFLYARVLQHAWKSFKELSYLSILLIVLFVGSMTAAAFYAVKKAIEGSKATMPPPTLRVGAFNPLLSPSPALNVEPSPSPIKMTFQSLLPISVDFSGETGIWDVVTGKLVTTLKGNTSDVTYVEFSPDNSRLIMKNANLTSSLWDTATGKPILELKKEPDNESLIGFSPDSQRVLTQSIKSETPHLRDAATGMLIADLAGYTFFKPGVKGVIKVGEGVVSASGFSRDGKHMLTKSKDRIKVWLWDTATGKVVAELNDVLEVKFSPSGLYLFTEYKNGVSQLLDVASGELGVELKGQTGGELFGPLFSPDSNRLVTGKESLRLWDTISGQLVAELAGDSYWSEKEPVVFSSDSQRMLTQSIGGTPRLRDVTTVSSWLS